MNLDCFFRDPHGCFAGVQFRHGRVGGEFFIAIFFHRRVHNQQTRCLNARRHVREHPLNRLELADLGAERLAFFRVCDTRFVRRLRDAERLRRNADASRVEHAHRDLEPISVFAEHCGCRRAIIFVRDFAGRACANAEFGFCLADDETREFGIHEEARRAAMFQLWLRGGEQDDEIGDGTARDPGLAPVDDVGIAVAHGAHFHVAGVTARLRFGQGERAQFFPGRNGNQEFFLLLFGAVLFNAMAVERVVHAHDRPVRRARFGDFFHRQDVAHAIESAAAVLGWDFDAHHSQFAHLLDGFHRELAGLVNLGRDRDDLFLREIARQVSNRLLFFSQLKIHR